MVRLKSIIGPHEFQHTIRHLMPDGGVRYERMTFRFDFDNDFRQDVPEEVWETIRGAYVDRSLNLRYEDAYRPL